MPKKVCESHLQYEKIGSLGLPRNIQEYLEKFLLIFRLAKWVEEKPKEKREIAARRIVDAFINKSPSIDLSELDLTTLPNDIDHILPARVDIHKNKLTKLSLKNALSVDCRENVIELINLPKATDINCGKNLLTSLKLPEANIVYCSKNNLTHLEVPKANLVFCYLNPDLKMENITAKHGCSIAGLKPKTSTQSQTTTSLTQPQKDSYNSY